MGTCCWLGVAANNRYFYRSPTGTFGIVTPINGAPATHGNGGTVGFAAQSPEQANAFHAAGKLDLAYLRELDGNKICALHRPAK